MVIAVFFLVLFPQLLGASSNPADLTGIVNRHDPAKMAAGFLEITRKRIQKHETDFQPRVMNFAVDGPPPVVINPSAVTTNAVSPGSPGVDVRTNTGVVVNMGSGHGAATGTGTNYSRKVVRYGNPQCPCVGFENIPGKVDFGKDKAGEAIHTPHAWDAVVPADYGTYCNAWPRPGDESGSERWCFIDSANCDIRSIPMLPVRAKLFTKAQFQAHGMYYSYGTCGGVDKWTAQHNSEVCVLKDEQQCRESAATCTLTSVEGMYHSSGAACVDKDLVQRNILPDISTWGQVGCRCVGFSQGVTHRKFVATVGDSHEKFEIDGHVGATCGTWDKGVHPYCKGSNGAIPDWCNKKWCYVDGCNCKGVHHAPKVTSYFREGLYQGHTMYFSYFTCYENERFSEALNEYSTLKYSPQSCQPQTNEADCLKKTLGRCTWMPGASGAQGTCIGTEIVRKDKCNVR